MTTYKSAEDYKAKMKNGSEWRKSNTYEVFAFNICLECRYFQQNSTCAGNCLLMEQENAYSGVIATATCNRYLDKRGFDINGKVIDPAALPKWIKTEKKNGEIFLANGGNQ